MEFCFVCFILLQSFKYPLPFPTLFPFLSYSLAFCTIFFTQQWDNVFFDRGFIEPYAQWCVSIPFLLLIDDVFGSFLTTHQLQCRKHQQYPFLIHHRRHFHNVEICYDDTIPLWLEVVLVALVQSRASLQ